MNYRITYLANNEYCELKPSDPQCHRSYTVEANSYIEAVKKMYQDIGGFDGVSKNITPTVWTYTVDNV